jgi:hypothetical protein
MDVEEAMRLVANVTYKPGWTLTALDHRNRFQDTILVQVDYVALNTNRDRARDGYPEEIKTYAKFPVIVGECPTEDALYQWIVRGLIAIEEHETREFFRIVSQDFRAPFHPHRIEGMRAWHGTGRTDVMPDLQFGL